MKHISLLIIICAAFICGAFFTYAIGRFEARVIESDVEIYSNAVLTNPYLGDLDVPFPNKELLDIRSKVSVYIDNIRAQDDTFRIGFYLRDLTTGAWVGIGEKEPFFPASLSKVPALIYALTQIEKDISVLNNGYTLDISTMLLENNLDNNLDFSMKDGEAYTLEQLLTRMISYSDNYAYEMVVNIYNIDKIDAFMKSIGFVIEDTEGDITTNTKSYSALFRALYNSSILNRASSEFALALLASNALDGGMKKYLDSNITIASKYGVYEFDDSHPANKNQFHECGIIYDNDYPFILCVMSSSSNQIILELKVHVEEISKIVFTNKDIVYEK